MVLLLKLFVKPVGGIHAVLAMIVLYFFARYDCLGVTKIIFVVSYDFFCIPCLHF